MDDRNYLIDTNVLVYYLDGSIPLENVLIDDIFRHSFIVSIITKIEFLGWSEYLVDAQALVLANEFIGAAEVVPLTDDIVDTVIDLRRQYRTRLPDCIIAATALERQATLVTRDVGDFEAMPVTVYNPFELSTE